MYSVYVIGKICCLVKPVFNIQCIKLNFPLGLLKPRNGFQGHKGTYIHTYIHVFYLESYKKIPKIPKVTTPPPPKYTHISLLLKDTQCTFDLSLVLMFMLQVSFVWERQVSVILSAKVLVWPELYAPAPFRQVSPFK